MSSITPFPHSVLIFFIFLFIFYLCLLTLLSTPLGSANPPLLLKCQTIHQVSIGSELLHTIFLIGHLSRFSSNYQKAYRQVNIIVNIFIQYILFFLCRGMDGSIGRGGCSKLHCLCFCKLFYSTVSSEHLSVSLKLIHIIVLMLLQYPFIYIP